MSPAIVFKRFLAIVAVGSALSSAAYEPTNALEVVSHDDLQWLVGRWRCIAREYPIQGELLMASNGDSLLDYFNVYLPYADDRITLTLSDNPEDRPIAAEFTVKRLHAAGAEGIRERLELMFEGGPVRIGKHRILYGPPMSGDFDFKYRVEEVGGKLWLSLESKAMRFKLVKVSPHAGDVRKSFVAAPVKNYTVAHTEELARRYEAARREAPGAASTRSSEERGP